jgi:hypothetical protein
LNFNVQQSTFDSSAASANAEAMPLVVVVDDLKLTAV